MNHLQHTIFQRRIHKAIMAGVAVASIAMGAMIALVAYQIGCQVLGL